MSTSVLLWAEPRNLLLLDGAGEQGAVGAADLQGRYGTLTLQVTGTFVATVTFEASQDGSNWIEIRGQDLNSGTWATSASAPGIFMFPVSGLAKIRVRVSAYTSGTVSVIGTATILPL